MSENVELSLILPAYNERASIASAIDEAFAYFQARGTCAEVIVSADGNDGTREVVRDIAAHRANVRVIGHEVRSGKGRGIREAVALARGCIIGYADADNKVPLAEYDRIEPWFNKGYDIVSGSRALVESRIERPQPWYRRAGSKGFYIFMQTVVGLPGIRDSQCGFKFFRRDAALRLFQLQRIDGYMFDVEVLAFAQRLGYRIKEVPIRWHDDADSRLELLSGNLRNVADIFRIRLYLAQSHEVPVTAAAVAGDD